MSRWLEQDGLNESQPAGSIPDFDPDGLLGLPSFEEAAGDAEAIFSGLSVAERSGSPEDIG